MYFLGEHFNGKNPFVKKLADEEALKQIYLDINRPVDRMFVHGTLPLIRLHTDQGQDLLQQIYASSNEFKTWTRGVSRQEIH